MIVPKIEIVENFHNDSQDFDIFNNRQKTISVDENDIIIVACPGNRLKFNDESSSEFLCTNSQLVSVQNQSETIEYSDLSCSKSISENLESTGRACGPTNQSGEIIDIGWSNAGSFKSMISVCHDKTNEQTFYAMHKLVGESLSAVDRDHKRPSSFQEGKNYYPRSAANSLYKQKTQEKLFSSLGLSEFFNKSQDVVLNRGHLAPNGDFIMKEWQDATFYFLNVAPQWKKKFNAGNWLSIEMEAKSFAHYHKKTMDVYTGNHDVLTLPDSTGNLQQVFLDKRKLILVPLLFWKILYDPIENKAIVFVGVNSLETFKPSPSTYQLCPDVCQESHWHFDQKDSLERGIIYCCSYQDFKLALEWIHFYNNPDILEG